jgi:hypothetical protein
MRGRMILVTALSMLFGVGSLFAQTTLPAPTNLEAQSEPWTLPGVRLTWQVPLIRGVNFKIYRSAADTTHFEPIGTTGMHVYNDFNVKAGNTYFYYVTSFIFRGWNSLESGPSNVASIMLGGEGSPQGTISGTVTSDSAGAPIPGVRIRFYRIGSIRLEFPQPFIDLQAFTDSLGHYEAKLDTGTYLIKAEPMGGMFWRSGYHAEWYDNATNPSDATPVGVKQDSVFTADFELAPIVPITYAYISGHVTDTSGMPLRNASVSFMRTIQEMDSLSSTTGLTPGLGEEAMDVEGVGYCRGILWHGRTDSAGNYQARVISGESYIGLASKFGYIPEYFNNESDPQDADIIDVAGDTTGIDFSLSPNPVYQNSISGMVSDSLSTGVPSRIVLFPIHHNMPWFHIRFDHTDSLGSYVINNVATGEYFVLAIPFSGYAPAFYKAGAYGVWHWKDADSVNVSGDVTGINIGVVPVNSAGFAHVEGKIQASDGTPLGGVAVLATTSAGDVVGCGLTDGNGNYSLDGVTAGAVTLTANKEGYDSATQSVNIPGGSSASGKADFTLSVTTVTSVEHTSDLPINYSLDQNYPNPFNPSTTISFDIPVSSSVTLRVFNVIGQEVRTLVQGTLSQGRHEIVWNGLDDAGRALASGIYFYSLNATPVSGGKMFSDIKKMVLLK